MFFYSSETEPFRGDLSKLDPTRQFLKHYSNLLYLSFVSRETKNGTEKWQAEKEIGICNRKLEFWKHRHGFSEREMLVGVEKLKKDWKMERPA